MKKIFILFLFLLLGKAFAQDVDTVLTWQTSYHDTLTATHDTVDVRFQDADQRYMGGFNLFLVSDGTDTVNVYSESQDGTTWAQTAVYTVANDTALTFYRSIPVSTTSLLYHLLDYYPYKIRIVSTSQDASKTLVILEAVGRR
jgi:hypothetical protein